MGKTKTQEAADKIVLALFPLNPFERREALATAKMTYCFDCGFPTPSEGYCHCTNDE